MAQTWKSFPIIVSPLKGYIQCFSVEEAGHSSLSLFLSPTPSTFSVLFIFSKVKNVKEENAVCLIALGHIQPGSAFFLFIWPTLWILHSNLCQVVCLSLRLSLPEHLKSHPQTHRQRQGLLSSYRPATLWYSGSSSHLSKSAPCHGCL